MNEGSGILRKILTIFSESSIIKFIIGILNNSLKPVIPLVNISINGQTFYAHTLDRLIALFLLKFGMWEKEEINLFKKTIKEGWTVLDIGANIGYPSLLLSKLVGKSGKVIAFEPDKNNIKILKKNIKANNIQNIKVVPMAVSDHTGAGTLFISDSHSGDHRIYNPSDEERKTRNIKTISLDDYFKSDNKIDFIQMDIEGAEGLVFKGMKKLLKKNKRISILLEFWPEALREIGSSPVDFLKMIEKLGFKINYVDRSSGKLTKISIEECMDVCKGSFDINLFLVR